MNTVFAEDDVGRVLNHMEITDNDIIHTIGLVFREYAKFGIRCSFPKNTDPKKTYQWRYLRALTLKFKEWDFDDDTAKQYIRIALEYARDNGTLHKKVLSIFHQRNMLEYCYKRLTLAIDDINRLLDVMQATHSWLLRQSRGRTLVELLTDKANNNVPNIIVWYEANRLPEAYLATTTHCSIAIAWVIEHCPEKMSRLPNRNILFQLRQRLISNELFRSRLHTMFTEIHNGVSHVGCTV